MPRQCRGIRLGTLTGKNTFFRRTSGSSVVPTLPSGSLAHKFEPRRSRGALVFTSSHRPEALNRRRTCSIRIPDIPSAFFAFRMPSPKNKKQRRKGKDPRRPSASSQESQSQVFPSRLPSSLHRPPTPSTSAAHVSRRDDPLDINYSEDLFATQQIPTPGGDSFEASLPSGQGTEEFSALTMDVTPSQDVPLDFRHSHDPRRRIMEALQMGDTPPHASERDDATEDAQREEDTEYAQREDVAMYVQREDDEATQMADDESPRDRPSEDETLHATAREETSDELTQEPRGKGVQFNKRVEGEIVEWLQAHPLLYDRGHTDYKNRHKKDRVMEEQARRVHVTKEELARWIHTKRTRYGKLTKKIEKSGAARVPLTDLDRWILDKFSFMKPHIVRQKEPRSLGIGQVRNILILIII